MNWRNKKRKKYMLSYKEILTYYIEKYQVNNGCRDMYCKSKARLTKTIVFYSRIYVLFPIKSGIGISSWSYIET